MFYTKIEKLPNGKRRRSNLRVFFDEFMSENIKIAKLNFDDGTYCSAKSAQNTLTQSAKRRGYPIDVEIINGEVYLIRRDI